MLMDFVYEYRSKYDYNCDKYKNTAIKYNYFGWLSIKIKLLD